MELYDSLRVTRVTKDRYCITLYFEGKKFRYYNGHSIGKTNFPNRLPAKERKATFERLLREFRMAIAKGWTPNDVQEVFSEICHGDALIDKALENKLSKPYSLHYQRKMRWICGELKTFLRGKTLNASLAAQFLNQSRWSPAMRNNLRSHYSSLESSLRLFGYSGTANTKVKHERISERLHRPFENTAEVLEEIKQFDRRLYLCCLLAYGCLLRPHREIRLLTWDEISLDKKQIALSGDRTKGKKNRIIPIPDYAFEELTIWSEMPERRHYLFGNSDKPFGPDFFNGLWTKFKKRSNLLKPEQTIYSFRHSGAIQLFEKTGSLTKLQQVMGHSSLQVSLTYLRGLQVKQLLMEDMPGL
jgi:integrase